MKSIVALLLLTSVCYGNEMTEYLKDRPDVKCFAVGTGFCTLAYCVGYVDKDGYHEPKCNTCTQSYECTDGKKFTIQEPSS